MKKVFSPKQKAEVALAALKGDQTIAQIARLIRLRLRPGRNRRGKTVRYLFG